jgi:hypothetical protein
MVKRGSSMNKDRWVVARDGVQIVAVQHGCGANDMPVNCSLDEYRNWVCPNCMSTYGASMPLLGWIRNDPQAALDLVWSRLEGTPIAANGSTRATFSKEDLDILRPFVTLASES